MLEDRERRWGIDFEIDNYDDSGSFLSRALVILRASGNVGIGTSTPWRTFSVSGTASFFGLSSESSSGSAVCLSANNELQVNPGVQSYTVSSARYKHDIETSNT